MTTMSTMSTRSTGSLSFPRAGHMGITRTGILQLYMLQIMRRRNAGTELFTLDLQPLLNSSQHASGYQVVQKCQR